MQCCEANLVTNVLFNTAPVIVHANGPITKNLYWSHIKAAFFAKPPQIYQVPEDLTIITCNNGGANMGVFEESLRHLGIPYFSCGNGIENWVNAVHKPRSILSALREIKTKYCLYADSRDALMISLPSIALGIFVEKFHKSRLLFGADRVNYPPCRRFKVFEQQLAGVGSSPFKFLNSGMWIGETEFCIGFFETVLAQAPVPEAQTSDQGLIRQLFPSYQSAIALDYQCQIFQNIGFLVEPILQVR